MALVPGVRRSSYSAAGNVDLSSTGTLVFAPGINAERERLVPGWVKAMKRAVDAANK